jgi:hypothetical protein
MTTAGAREYKDILRQAQDDIGRAQDDRAELLR